MIILFDFETDGIGRIEDQHPIQLAWMLIDKTGNIISKRTSYINGIKQINTDFHKHLTASKINKDGRSLRWVIDEFLDDMNRADEIVAHNIKFDLHILSKSITHLGDKLPNFPKRRCTMRDNVEYVGRCFDDGNLRYPRLVDLYTRLFQREPDIPLHDAMNDVMVLYMCYKKLYL